MSERKSVIDIGYPEGQTMAKIFQCSPFGVFLGHKKDYISQVSLKLDGPYDPELCPVEYRQVTVTSRPPVLKSGTSSFSFI